MVVLATPPFWLATARSGSSRRARGHHAAAVLRSAPPSMNAVRHVATHCPGHRTHAGIGLVLRPPARRVRARPGAGRRAPANGWRSSPRELARAVRRRGGGARRRPRRPRPSWPPSRPRLADRVAPGRPAGEQRRLRAEAARSSTTRVEDEQYLLDVLVTAVLRLTHAALGPMVRARRRRGRQRLQRRGLPAARHVQRRQGLRHLAERVGRPDLPRTRACG